MRPIHILLFALGFSPVAAAQSFDCKLAKSPREHAVCSDQRLAALDSAVSYAYNSLRAQLSPESAALVQSDQREWLHWLDVVCPAHGGGIADKMNRCLSNEYTNRERDLGHVVHIGTTLLFPRSHFLYKAGSPNEERVAGNDPGFGYGSLRWPQIDIQPARPNPVYTEWNSAVKKKAAKLAVGIDSENKNATFDTAVDASGTIDGFYIVEAVNDRFIDISLVDSAYGWGAAHPLTGEQVSSGGSSAIASSLSRMSSSCRAIGGTNLPPWPISNLRAQPDLKDMLGDDIQKAVNETIPTSPLGNSPAAASPSPSANTQSAPTLRACLKRILWSDLKPYLAPDLQPTTLSVPTPNQTPENLDVRR